MKQLAFDFDATTKTMPVELLRDHRGVYGIGVPDSFNDEASYWPSSIHPPPEERERRPGCLILRPDRFEGTHQPYDYAVLQKITGGFRRSIFRHSIEEQLRSFIHHEALRRSGLSWPPQHSKSSNPIWWAEDKKQQARNRQIYHGLRLLSLQVINRLIGQAHEEAANADAIKAARRFTFKHREQIYRAASASRRALQLVETFPVLALNLYSEFGWPTDQHANIETWSLDHKNEIARKKAAIDLVERGVRLRDVAAAMDVPMALRCIKPGAAHLAFNVFRQRPELLRFMPEALPRSKIWLGVVSWSSSRVSPDFAAWAARNVPQIPGRLEQVGSFLGDLSDWVRAGLLHPPRPAFADEDFPEPPRGRQFVTRPFTPSMSLKTVTKLSADWHEAVAAGMSGPQFTFPPAWYPAAKLGAYDILPIEDSGSLYREGAAMHHCVGTYAPEVRGGGICVYSVRCEGQRLATLALGRYGKRASVIQLRGPCNTEPPKQIASTVQRWLRAQPPFEGVPESPSPNRVQKFAEAPP